MNKKQISISIVSIFCVVGMMCVGLELRNQYKLKKAYAAIESNSISDIKKFATIATANRYFVHNNKKTTLLHQAIIQRPDDAIAHEIISYLLSIGVVDVDKPEKILKDTAWLDGRKPIHSAVERGNPYAVNALINAKANIHAIDPITHMEPINFVKSETNPVVRDAWHLNQIESLLEKELRRP